MIKSEWNEKMWGEWMTLFMSENTRELSLHMVKTKFKICTISTVIGGYSYCGLSDHDPYREEKVVNNVRLWGYKNTLIVWKEFLYECPYDVKQRRVVNCNLPTIVSFDLLLEYVNSDFGKTYKSITIPDYESAFEIKFVGKNKKITVGNEKAFPDHERVFILAFRHRNNPRTLKKQRLLK